MPIDIKFDKPDAGRLGGAHFFPPLTDPHRRNIGTRAEADDCLGPSPRPITLHVSANDHRTNLDLSTDEAEALIACLAHAVALRREAEVKKAA